MGRRDPDPKKAKDFQKGFENPDPIVRKLQEWFGGSDEEDEKEEKRKAFEKTRAMMKRDS